MAIRVNQDSFEVEVLQAKGPVLVDFYSDSCIPCKQMSPILSQLAEEYGEQVKIVKVNVNFDMELADRYLVMGAPTFVVFVDGKVVNHSHGVKKREEIKELIEEFIL
ncbi:thioredoxin [Anaerosporobacter mobilis DSM 15930]|uniref:Thioredoxin n=1 Tax=Anaerosporobacter mobilis DSM 15930 TaxID=1120996 RepID=A0A1M7G4U6_9FIRM|nr:thioredoxin family protein [Anaerosporobacter mobilis]SHM11175.1 thioredoxin [Anaerosporobacter mobilis DSM 15930]